MNDLTFQARAAMSRAILARLALMVEPLLDAQDRGIARYTMDPIPTPSPGSEFTRAQVKINLPSERTDIARLNRNPSISGVCGRTFRPFVIAGLKMQARREQDVAAVACYDAARSVCADTKLQRTADIAKKCAEFK